MNDNMPKVSDAKGKPRINTRNTHAPRKLAKQRFKNSNFVRKVIVKAMSWIKLHTQVAKVLPKTKAHQNRYENPESAAALCPRPSE
jgi:hypothetical protein